MQSKTDRKYNFEEKLYRFMPKKTDSVSDPERFFKIYIPHRENFARVPHSIADPGRCNLCNL
jgi:hypothetical protein